MTPNFEAMARPGLTDPDMWSRAKDMMASSNSIEFLASASWYDHFDKLYFSGAPISPAGDRWDNRRKARPGGQYTLIV